jgi:hypothetical protein
VRKTRAILIAAVILTAGCGNESPAVAPEVREATEEDQFADRLARLPGLEGARLISTTELPTDAVSDLPVLEATFEIEGGRLVVYRQELDEVPPVEDLAGGNEVIRDQVQGAEVLSIVRTGEETTQSIVLAEKGEMTNFVSQATDLTQPAPLTTSELHAIAIESIGVA